MSYQNLRSKRYNVVSELLTTVIRIWKILGSNLDKEIGYPAEASLGYPYVLQTISEYSLFQIRPPSLPHLLRFITSVDGTDRTVYLSTSN
jgi:hypothetical protein